jgi:hypothetical protein
VTELLKEFMWIYQSKDNWIAAQEETRSIFNSIDILVSRFVYWGYASKKDVNSVSWSRKIWLNAWGTARDGGEIVPGPSWLSKWNNLAEEEECRTVCFGARNGAFLFPVKSQSGCMGMFDWREIWYEGWLTILTIINPEGGYSAYPLSGYCMENKLPCFDCDGVIVSLRTSTTPYDKVIADAAIAEKEICRSDMQFSPEELDVQVDQELEKPKIRCLLAGLATRNPKCNPEH